ncbi:MAG: prepilin-type N-terminal cleavage/methylation domain-containing protein [Phycisphaerae bacterium]
MPRSRATPLRHGFTLLEVMVVAAIIALLLAILVPSLDSARRQARRTLCASNLAQQARAWHAYLNDNRGFFHQLTRAELNYGGRQGEGSPQFGANPKVPVRKPLNRYLGLPVVTRDRAEPFLCPDDAGTPQARPTAFWYYGTSYRTNPMLIGPTAVNVSRPNDPCADAVFKPVNQRLAGLNRSRVANESRLLLIGDHGWSYTWDLGITDRNDLLAVNWHRRLHFHNLAFLDGHVSFIRVRKGIHTDGQYTVIPFRDLQAAATSCQVEVADE